MKKRCFLYIQSLIALLIGLLIYILFRKGTYIHNIFHISRTVYIGGSFWGENFIRYAMPDFLWSYALSSALLGVYCPRRFGGVIIAGLTTATGILWELLQLLSLVGGTFDIIDCIMYFIASVISNYIYHKLE